MRKTVICVVVSGCVMFLAGIAVAQQALVQQKVPFEKILEGCYNDVETYCENVTPGEGRLLVCLYAHNDKISTQCEYALYNASAQLKRVLNALSYVANECRDDLKQYCSDVKPGEGRLIDCIAKKKDVITDRCKNAIKDVSQE
jgi:hypothetical protein